MSQKREIREIRYYKPSMTNLKGKLGRNIINTIKNTPPSDHSKLNVLADKGIKSILAERNNERNNGTRSN